MAYQGADPALSPFQAAISTEQVITDFVYRARQDVVFCELLGRSLGAANANAKENLAPVLYDALQWPTNVLQYTAYLVEYARWKPRETLAPAWQVPDSAFPSETQEVYDRLCHFYFLIDQPLDGVPRAVLQNYPWFREWLTAYSAAWGDFLDTPASFDEVSLQGFMNDSSLVNYKNYRLMDSMLPAPGVDRNVWPPQEPNTWRPNSPSGWISFNQFFARELNPGLRPISNPMDNGCVVAPADTTFKAQYKIAENGDVYYTDDSGSRQSVQFKLKKTHTIGNVHDLLKGSKYADSFGNGVFVHYFLGPYSYHRFHAPVSGTVQESLAITERVYLAVQLKDGQFDAPDDARDGYQFNQSRGIISIDTSTSPYGNVGVVTVVPIGMAQVSGVNMTALPGDSNGYGGELLKGEEFGYFTFGSDIIVLFQEQANAQIIPTGEDYVHYGSHIANCVVGAPQ